MYKQSMKELLGESHTSMQHKLKRVILFKIARECGSDKCYKCSYPIVRPEDITIEHKISWRQGDTKEKCQELFWATDNIAFSHRWCNTPDTITGTNKNGYIGVYSHTNKNTSTGKVWYRATFGSNKKKTKISVGYYDTKKQAAMARDMGVIRHWGCGVLNFPDKFEWYKEQLELWPNHKDWKDVLKNVE